MAAFGKGAGERPEPRERAGRLRLVEAGRRRLRPAPRGRSARVARPRRRRAPRSAACRAAAARHRRRGGRRPCRVRARRSSAASWAGGASRRTAAGASATGTKIGRLRAKSGWSRLPAVTAYAVSGSRSAADLPGLLRLLPHPPRTARCRGSAARRRSSGGGPDSWVSRATVPSGQRLKDCADPRLERVVPGEQLLGRGALPGLVQAQPLAQVDGLAVDPNAEVERERRSSGAHLRPFGRDADRVAARRGGDACDGSPDDEGQRGDDDGSFGCGRSRVNGSREHRSRSRERTIPPGRTSATTSRTLYSGK